MSKEAAMALATGQPVTEVNHSLITGDMSKGTLNPELTPTETLPTNEAVQAVLQSEAPALLAKKEVKLFKREEAIKEREAKLEEEKKRLKEFHDKIQSFEAKRQTDPVSALKDIGFTETEIFNFMSGAEKKEPTAEEIARNAASQEINKFKEEQDKIAKGAEKARNEALIKNYSTQITSALKANPEKYEYANYFGKEAQDLAIEIAKQNVEINGDLLSPDEVAAEVEKYYEDEDKAMSALKKRQPKIETQSTEGAKTPVQRTRTVVPPVGAPIPAAKTLTNKTTATVASTINRRETHDQKKDRLISALKAGTYKPA